VLYTHSIARELIIGAGDSGLGIGDWDIFLNFSLLLTCWPPPLRVANGGGDSDTGDSTEDNGGAGAAAVTIKFKSAAVFGACLKVK